MMTLGSFFSYLFGIKSTSSSQSPPPSENSSSSADESSLEPSSSDAPTLPLKDHEHPFIPASKHFNLPVRRRQREGLLLDLLQRLRNVESEIQRNLREYEKTYNLIGSMAIEQKQEAALEVLEIARELENLVEHQRQLIPWRRKDYPRCAHREITHLEPDEADVDGLVPSLPASCTANEQKAQTCVTFLVDEMVWSKSNVLGLAQKAAHEWVKGRSFDKEDRELQANALVECLVDSVQQEFQSDQFLTTTEKDVMAISDSLLMLEDRIRSNNLKEAVLGDSASDEDLRALKSTK
uniref:PLU-1 domain-containing protein n=1 Tax=Panagrellus redivivus TaxID=6233 RepID=A0A7E4VFC4_PANRE